MACGQTGEGDKQARERGRGEVESCKKLKFPAVCTIFHEYGHLPEPFGRSNTELQAWLGLCIVANVHAHLLDVLG